MFAFYAVRGYTLSEFANLSELEKIFLHHARATYYEEERKKYETLFGSGR